MLRVSTRIVRASRSRTSIHPAAGFLPLSPYRLSISLPITLPSRSFSSTYRIGAPKGLEELPDKVSLKTGPIGRLSKVLPPRQSTCITTRVGSSFGGRHSLEWCQPPTNVLIVKKQRSKETSQALRGVVEHLRKQYPRINIILEAETRSSVAQENADVYFVEPEEHSLLPSKVDLVITLGGDGTILHVSSLFERSDVPPVLSFSMGTLGFLMPFHIDTFATAFKDVIDSQASLLLRMRLRQSTHHSDGTLIRHPDGTTSEIHLMNEVALHRASSPHMTTIDAFVDGRHLTQAISDGLIIATPTGSTAYSLSAGGPIVHPSVQSILLTPICPRSLSFRPVLLPSDANVQLMVSKRSRAAAQVSVDGREVRSLEPGQYLQVEMSPFPIPCVIRKSSHRLEEQRDGGVSDDNLSPRPPSGDRATDDWAGDINTLLRFNASFSGRGLLGGNGSYEDNE